MTTKRFERIMSILNKRQPDLTVLMENVHKPHNLAAIARSCDAVGIHEIHAIAETEYVRLKVTPASGSSKWVNLNVQPDLETACQKLHDQGMTIYAAHLDETAVDFKKIDYTKPTAILVGAELDGISERALKLADVMIKIPMLGAVESLNVSVATALILFEAQRQRQKAGLYDHSRLDPEMIKPKIFECLYPRVAKLYKQKGIAYPELDETGNMIRSRVE